MLIGNDTQIGKALNKLGDIVILNIVFIVTSIPVITITTSFSSLLYVYLRMQNFRDDRVLKTYFKAFRSNFKYAAVFEIISFIFIYFMIVNVNIISIYNTVLSNIVKVIFTFLTVTIIIYFCANLAAFENIFKTHLINAVLMSFKHILSSLIMFIVTVLITYFSIVDTKLFALYLFSWSFFMFSAMAYFYSYILMKVFRNYEPYKTSTNSIMKEN